MWKSLQTLISPRRRMRKTRYPWLTTPVASVTANSTLKEHKVQSQVVVSKRSEPD